MTRLYCDVYSCPFDIHFAHFGVSVRLHSVRFHHVVLFEVSLAHAAVLQSAITYVWKSDR